MDSESKFDEKLRDKLQDHSVTPPPYIWNKVAQSRIPPKGGFEKLWWTLPSLLLLIGAGAYLMNGFMKAPVDSTGYVMPEHQQVADASSNFRNETVTEEITEPVTMYAALSSAGADTKQVSVKNAVQYNTRREAQGKSARPTTLNATGKADAQTHSSSAKQEAGATTGKNKGGIKTGVEAASTDDKNIITQSQDNQQEPVAAAGEKTLTVDDPAVQQEADQQTETAWEENTATAEAAGPALAYIEHASADPVAEPVIANPELEQPVKNDSAASAQVAATAAPRIDYVKNHPLSLEVYILPEGVTRQLSEKPGMQEPDYLDLRNESETIENAFGAGINLRYELSARYFVRAGIRYSTITESYFAKRNSTQSIATDSVVIRGYVVDPFRDPVPIYATTTTYHDTSFYFEQASNIRYSFIDIPVSAGIQWRWKQFGFYLSAGMELNVLASASGEIPDPHSTGTLALNAGNYPLKTTTFSMLSGVGVTYHMLPRMAVIVEPNFRKQLSSMTSDVYILDQKYTRIGVIAGIKYDFK
jgi:hypothetical protein